MKGISSPGAFHKAPTRWRWDTELRAAASPHQLINELINIPWVSHPHKTPCFIQLKCYYRMNLCFLQKKGRCVTMDGFFPFSFCLFIYFFPSLCPNEPQFKAWNTWFCLIALFLVGPYRLFFFFPNVFHFFLILAFDSICYFRKNNKNKITGQLLLVLFNFCRSKSRGEVQCGNILPSTFRMSALGILHYFPSPLFVYSVKCWEHSEVQLDLDTLC